LNPAGVFRIEFFEKIECFKEVMPGDDIPFLIDLRCVEPETERIGPIMYL